MDVNGVEYQLMYLQLSRNTSALVMLTCKFKELFNNSTTVSTDRTAEASTKAPLGVNTRQLGPRLHLPRQFTPTTGMFDGVKNENVAIVASDPFSLHHNSSW